MLSKIRERTLVKLHCKPVQRQSQPPFSLD
jgi:hypothetical protein